VENIGRLICDSCGEYVGFARIELKLACLELNREGETVR
jgi:hypothetical protein